MSRSLVFGFALLACLADRHAAAQTLDSEANVSQSNALFETGRTQFAQGDVAAACESFEQSFKLVRRAGTLLNLGICHERAQQLLLARRELIEARAMALHDNRSDRAALADARITAIESQLGWIQIEPASELARDTVHVKVDGEPVAVLPNEPIPVLPGEHSVRLEAEPFEPREVRLNIASQGRVSVMFPPAQASAPAPEITEEAHAPLAPAVATAPVARDEPSSALGTAALVVGIVGLTASVATGVWALERKAVIQRECDQKTRECSPSGLSAASTGSAAALVSTVTLVVGVTGFGVWLFAPGGPLDDAFASGGVSVRGTF